ncbi:MAG: ABC transporter permease [Eubacteriales bacterium]|nr:ABC transporter permease [Eubacteriales bacterium]
MTQLFEYIKMAFKNIAANKGRTLLTMLGIIIGISSVILIMSIGNGATKMISSELGSIGNGQIYFQLLQYEEKYIITQDDLDNIRQIDGVKAVCVQEYYQGQTQTKRNQFDAVVVAINPDGFEFMDYEFVKGGQFTEAQAQEGKGVCVLTESDAMKLFGSTNVVGKDIDVEMKGWGGASMTLTVVGVAKSDDLSAMVEGYVEIPSVQLIVPPQAITKATGYDVTDYISEFYVLKEDDAEGQKVCDEVIHYLETKHHCKGENVYMYSSFEDTMKTINGVMKLITVFVAFVASVSLLVGGIGVMNIMLVSVTERTREIGIRKALGAKTGSITVQFLAESAFITMLGGIIGIIVGVAGAWVISAIIGMAVPPELKFSPALSIQTVLGATLFSSAVGILFGVYPARKAAKLSPIEALRHN